MQASAAMQRSAALQTVKELIWRKGDERCERSSKALAHTSVVQALAAPQQQQAGFRQVSTKREEASAKMNERYLVGQPNQNPFRPSNNYLEDIEVQMNFLTPQKSC